MIFLTFLLGYINLEIGLLFCMMCSWVFSLDVLISMWRKLKIMYLKESFPLEMVLLLCSIGRVGIAPDC